MNHLDAYFRLWQHYSTVPRTQAWSTGLVSDVTGLSRLFVALMLWEGAEGHGLSPKSQTREDLLQ